MATFFDSHAHLADPAFAADADAAVERALTTGALGVLCIGESIETSRRAERLAGRHPGRVWFSAGVHPHDAVGFDRARDVPALRQRVAAGAVAVGECGLDYHYDNSPRDTQRAAFDAQIALAAELELPLIVHTRDAEDDTRAMVREASAAGVRGVLHCYTGSASLAEDALAVGWYVSFSGIVTFRSWTDSALLRLVPDDRLLVESDAPYLAPVPHRGRRNEPAWVSFTVARLAEVRGSAADALGVRAATNACALFCIRPGAVPDASAPVADAPVLR